MTRSVYTLLLLFFTWILTFQPSQAQTIETNSAFSEGFERPLGIEYSHEGSSLLYIVGRSGKVVIKDTQNPDIPSRTFIDISDKVIASGELGLLGMAFSPEFLTDNTFYLYYAYEIDGEYYSTLARYKANDGVGDPASEERLFELLQPQDNHNGGQITFGPDGYLYIGLGDGGRSSSSLAQNTNVLNGSILRIDVSTEIGYDIPPDNPFLGDPNGRDEIYAWGFRNPWRISFDSETGNLWVADVGQKDRETIYIVEKGKNYGWPTIEGTLCYPIGTENCDKTGLEEPVFEYPWNEEDTGKSITGGYVYRGDQNPSLYGKYIYGDFISKRIWALEIDYNTREVISNDEIALSDQLIPTFGIDGKGEIYIGGWSGGTDSRIYRFSPELTLTTAALKSVDGTGAIQLTWETNKESDVESFELYKGASIDQMELYQTVSGVTKEFTDTQLFEGGTFYAVRAIETGGEEDEMSDPVSYYQATNNISQKWQMISLPYETIGESIPNTVAYDFDGSYLVEEQLQPRKGYWILSNEEAGTDYSAAGVGVQSAALQLNQGWNLIGGLVGDLPKEFLVDEARILNSTPMYGFNGFVYEEAGSFVPGQGYWIYSDEAGEITLDLEDVSYQLPLKSGINGTTDPFISSGTFDRIEFESGGQTAGLFVTENSVATDVLNRFRLPPVAPGASLDVRTSNGFKLAEGARFEPSVIVNEFPLTVRFVHAAQKDRETGLDVYFKLMISTDGITDAVDLRVGQSYVISEEFDRIEFQRFEAEDEIVRETKLLPSYPNPFNPTTTITYRLSEQQQVSLTVFDTAGRRIATLVKGEQSAGQYSLPFDASGLASGIYFVRFTAGDVFSTQKLTLIK